MARGLLIFKAQIKSEAPLAAGVAILSLRFALADARVSTPPLLDAVAAAMVRLKDQDLVRNFISPSSPPPLPQGVTRAALLTLNACVRSSRQGVLAIVATPQILEGVVELSRAERIRTISLGPFKHRVGGGG
jgi:hypothetical protein